MDFNMNEYTHAIVGKVKPPLKPTDKTDLNDARLQHESFLRLLRELELEVIELDFNTTFPGNMLVEDSAIVCHGIALMMRPTSEEEQLKSKLLEDALRSLGQTIVQMGEADAKLAGTDVLFTGREFFVGICDTTNEAGASMVAETFPEFPCTPIQMPKDSKSIKHYMTVAGDDLLCISQSKMATEIKKRMTGEASHPYLTLTVPEDDAANCLYVNGTLIHRAIEEIPSSFKVFCDKIDYARRSICFSEIAKVSRGLTSCVQLVKKF